jgi:hypothetical protein
MQKRIERKLVTCYLKCDHRNHGLVHDSSKLVATFHAEGDRAVLSPCVNSRLAPGINQRFALTGSLRDQIAMFDHALRFFNHNAKLKGMSSIFFVYFMITFYQICSHIKVLIDCSKKPSTSVRKFHPSSGFVNL